MPTQLDFQGISNRRRVLSLAPLHVVTAHYYLDDIYEELVTVCIQIDGFCIHK